MQAKPRNTILLRDGTYRLDRMLDIAAPGVTLRGESGDPSRVLIVGEGMEERKVGVALSVSAPRITLANLTVGRVGLHGVQVRGEKGADGVVLHNVHVVDTGEQLLKGSMSRDGRGPHGGLVACSRFGYSDHAPGDYTNGVDVLGGRGWTVRGNVFRNIRGPEGRRQAGPAVLFWRGSSDSVVEGNLVLDCYRGIALGLTDRMHDGPGRRGRYADHVGGLIRRNAVCNLNRWADEAIEANACPGVRIEHNSVMVEGQMPWSISVRFPATEAVVRNNLTNRRIAARNGAELEAEGNIADARLDWFVAPSRGDLRLARGDLAAVDAAAVEGQSGRDFGGTAPDVGAYEYEPPR